jgi:chromosome segregation ATPase
MEQVRKERAAKATAHREEIEALELEQEQLQQKLEPLLKESAAARRRATDLRAALIKLDGRIANVEAGRGKWADSASQAAELAALRAEREGVAKDEPVIAAELDALVPRIAAIEAARDRLRRKVVELGEEEEEDAKRSDELLSAIAAKRKVVERATADAEKARERMLAELGERLYVDRPRSLAAHLSPIDSLDLELGDIQRRMMELKEILASVDRWKLARGLVLWVLIAGAIGAGVWFYLQGQLPFLPAP